LDCREVNLPDGSLRYRPNTPKVIYETYDDEVVLINMDSGNYYSLNRTAGRAWASIERRITAQEIARDLRRDYACDGAQVEEEVLRFVKELHQEGLIVADEEAPPAPAASAAAPAAQRPPFEPPVLQKFSDMADLLLLDPIHEVDENGWPHQPPPPGK
jgi:hypothetical protein